MQIHKSDSFLVTENIKESKQHLPSPCVKYQNIWQKKYAHLSRSALSNGRMHNLTSAWLQWHTFSMAYLCEKWLHPWSSLMTRARPGPARQSADTGSGVQTSPMRRWARWGEAWRCLRAPAFHSVNLGSNTPQQSGVLHEKTRGEKSQRGWFKFVHAGDPSDVRGSPGPLRLNGPEFCCGILCVCVVVCVDACGACVWVWCVAERTSPEAGGDFYAAHRCGAVHATITSTQGQPFIQLFHFFLKFLTIWPQYLTLKMKLIDLFLLLF